MLEASARLELMDRRRLAPIQQRPSSLAIGSHFTRRSDQRHLKSSSFLPRLLSLMHAPSCTTLRKWDKAASEIDWMGPIQRDFARIMKEIEEEKSRDGY